MPSIKIRLDFVTKLKNGNHPVVLQVTWGNHVRRKRIKGFTCKRRSWDFDNHRYLHSNRKNDLLDEYEKKARRIADFMEEWDYKRFVKELKCSDQKNRVESRKVIQFSFDLEKEFITSNQIGYSRNFRAIGNFLQSCFETDIWIRDFGERELKILLREFDKRKIKGYNYLNYLKIVLTESIKRGYSDVLDSPIKTKFSPNGYDINKRKKYDSKYSAKKRIKDLSEEEKERILTFYHENDLPKGIKKHLAYWVLGYNLFGVNFKDLALMKWSDIDNGFWKYRRAKTGVKNNVGKPIPESAMQILKEYNTDGTYILDVLNGYDKNPERIQTRLANYKANMRRSFKWISVKLELGEGRYFTWYSTRYTSATLAIEKGIDLNTVKTLLDHSDLKTTSKYVGMVRDKKKLIEAITIL